MKMYVLMGDYGYDVGRVLIGVYNSYEEAEMNGKDFFEKEKEDYVIREMEVGDNWKFIF